MATKKATKAKTSSKDVEEGKAFAIITWIFFLIGLIWFFADEKMKKNKFAKFQLKQVLVLVITAIILSIAGAILLFIPVLGTIIYFAVNIAIFILWLLGLIAAINGEEKELPIIGQYAKHFKF